MTVAVPDTIEELRGRTTELLSASRRGDGRQFVLRVDGGPQPLILKHYGHKRSPWKTAVRQLGYRLGLGLSSVWPADRFRTERDLLELWREAGCDVPQVRASGNRREPWILMEYCPGPALKVFLRGAETSAEDKLERIRQLSREVGHRHRLALARQDARLIHTHPSTQHVLVFATRLVFFDLETCYRSQADVAPLIARELLDLIQSILQCLPEQVEAALQAFLTAYPDPPVLATLRSHHRRRPWRGRPLRFRRRHRPPPGGKVRFPQVPRARILDLIDRTLARPAPR